jgi:hypothetical protein
MPQPGQKLKPRLLTGQRVKCVLSGFIVNKKTRAITQKNNSKLDHKKESTFFIALKKVKLHNI